MRRYHDVGGTPAGPINRDERETPAWEKRVDAMIAILHRKGVMRLATAKDEIAPLTDFRVQKNRAYLVIILLARVISKNVWSM